MQTARHSSVVQLYTCRLFYLYVQSTDCLQLYTFLRDGSTEEIISVRVQRTGICACTCTFKGRNRQNIIMMYGYVYTTCLFYRSSSVRKYFRPYYVALTEVLSKVPSKVLSRKYLRRYIIITSSAKAARASQHGRRIPPAHTYEKPTAITSQKADTEVRKYEGTCLS